MLPDVLQAFAQLHRDVYLGLGQHMAELTKDAPAMLSAIVFAFALGLLHAMTPGHGKAIVFSYLLGYAGRPAHGMAMGLKVAITHVLSGIAVFVVVRYVLEWATDTTLREVQGIRTASYILVAMTGFYLLVRAVWRRNDLVDSSHARHGAGGGRPSGVLSFAVGLLPCPLTVLVLTYALANGTLATGLALTAVMALGVATTIGLVGTLAVLARKGIIGSLGERIMRYDGLLRMLEIGSAVIVMVFGIAMLVGLLTPAARNPFAS
jgi:nickel/cobalt exporter